MLEKMALKGFEVVDLECGKGDAVLMISQAGIMFNEATAVELGHPEYVRVLINKLTRQVAIEPCREDDKNAIPFEKRETGNEGILLQTPAVLMETKRLAGFENEAETFAFEGMLYYGDQVIIFDLSQRNQTINNDVFKYEKETNEAVNMKEKIESGALGSISEDALETEAAAMPRRRGRPKKVAVPVPTERLIITTNPGEATVVIPKNRGWRTEAETEQIQ